MSRRPLHPDEAELWRAVTAGFSPTPLRLPPKALAPKVLAPKVSAPEAPAAKPAIASPPSQIRPKAFSPPEPIEPRRKGRISRERDPIDARLDLHGLDQDRARSVLHGFLQRAHDQGFRAVLVITGKGVLGDGVLRRRAPDWLSDPAVRPIVAGFSQAHHRHGGEGAYYVALKRKAGR